LVISGRVISLIPLLPLTCTVHATPVCVIYMTLHMARHGWCMLSK
jgi:hypothetical protein